MAPLIPNGPYMIANQSFNLTLMDGQAVWLPREESENQIWIVENVSNNHVALKNAQTNRYLGGPGEELHVMQPLVESDNRIEFTVHEAEERTFKLVKMCEEERGCLGIHVIKVFPPWATLLPEHIFSGGLEFQPV